MLPAVTWDGDGQHGPSVLGRLRWRAAQLSLGDEAQCVLVALLFAMPDSAVIRLAEQRTEYFDTRTGTSWDLYFAGYYRWEVPGYDVNGKMLAAEDDSPRFSAREFNAMRNRVSGASGWTYSGKSDLVLVNAFVAGGHDPVIDWASTRGGPLVDANDRYLRHSLSEVIEFLTDEIEGRYESDDWNVADRLWPQASSPPNRLVTFARDVLASVVATVVAGPITGGLSG